MPQESSDVEKAPSDTEAAPPKESEQMTVDVVDWDGPDNAANPVNWSRSKRWAHIIIVAILAFFPSMAITIIAPGIDGVLTTFNVTSSAISSLAVTIFLLGLALGPMIFSSIGDIYGRLPIYHAGDIFFIAFVIGNALSKNIAQFMVFRFLSGCAGGMPLVMGGGTIADVTLPAKRGLATALFSFGPLAGPVYGPVVGGFLASSNGWRWTFWLLAILGGAVEVLTFLLMRETHPKILLERKAARLRAATGNKHLTSKLAHTMTPRQVLTQALIRPSILLIRSPIVLALSLYAVLVFGILYLLFTTFNDVFQGQYGFSASLSGLVYLGLSISVFLGIIIFINLNPRIQEARMKADGVDRPKPEYRLLLMIWLSPCVALGLFIYGWTVQYRVHWILPIIGTCFVGLGVYFVLMPTQLYFIELFGSKGASAALSANNVLRYLGGTFLPIAGPRLYKALDYGWGNTLLGFLALLLAVPPVLFYKFGERLRAKKAVDLL
ncbi:MAG: hypothetical protein LQ352_004294 [Teloschistes flavicans]|nr:MAG: hypothetical protein LQ352_004294 [Teloschistes flavicans]